MKNLVWVPQLSNIVDGKFTLDLDSNNNLFLGRAREILQQTDWNIYYVIPMRNNDVQHSTTVLNLFSELRDYDVDARLHILYYPFVNNPFMSRFDFSHKSWLRTLEGVKPDVVVVNDPCLVKNFKAFFYVRDGKIPGIISYNHFIDNPSDPKVAPDISYWDYQVAGACAADLNVFTCESTLEMFKSEVHPSVKNKFSATVWDAGYSAAEIDDNRPKVDLFSLKKDTTYIFFPNRISAFQDYTNGLALLEACDKLWEKRQDFRLICANPSQKYTNKELREKCRAVEVLKDGAFTKEEYYSLLYQCHLGASLYTHDRYGGCAMREYVHAGMFPVMTNLYAYKELMDKIDWPYKFRVDSDLNDLVDILDIVIFECQNDHISRFSQWQHDFAQIVSSHCSYESTTGRVIDDIRSVYGETGTRQ